MNEISIVFWRPFVFNDRNDLDNLSNEMIVRYQPLHNVSSVNILDYLDHVYGKWK